ncbi:hypothetical protein BC938DRAFT_472943 [Jimgerdemannia flammicorona]|uniref:Uncharacterized protein n=1 Tax=Jimgerdemannia flammicorona TaxID=994334 RepID=A0A433Q537_9FUNG|nr:hypothetical protein BC938DRAFT_472943 [Jimgerdemannia flammicorona]
MAQGQFSFTYKPRIWNFPPPHRLLSVSEMDSPRSQKPHQWNAPDAGNQTPRLHFPRTGDAVRCESPSPSPRFQHANQDDEPETPIGEIKHAQLVNLDDLRRTANLTQRAHLRHIRYGKMFRLAVEDAMRHITTRPHPDPKTTSDSLSQSPIGQSTSTSNPPGTGPMRLRVITIMHGQDKNTAGSVTPITTDSFDALVCSVKLIHDIDDDVQVELILNRGGGVKISQRNMSELRKDDVLVVKIIGSIHERRTAHKGPHLVFSKRSPLYQSPNELTPILAGFPADSSSADTSLIFTKPRFPRLNKIKPDSSDASPVQDTFDFKPPSLQAQTPLVPPKSKSVTQILSESNAKASTSSSRRSPSPPPLPQRSPSRLHFFPKSPQRTASLRTASLRTATAERSNSLRTRPVHVSPAFSRVPMVVPSDDEFFLIISPLVCDKGHRSAFPNHPFMLNYVRDRISGTSTVSELKDLLKKFQACPDLALYFHDTELAGETKRLCDLGVRTGSVLFPFHDRSLREAHVTLPNTKRS